MKSTACRDLSTRRHSPARRPARAIGSAALALSACVLLASSLPRATAQQLMVGADGAVHLDEFNEVQADEPVVIQEEPQLVPPSFQSQAEFGGPSAPSMQAAAMGSAQAYGACSVPFVPYLPVADAAVEQPLPIAYSFFGEFLYLHPTGADVVHAQQQDGPGGGTSLLGQVGTTDLHYEPGVRIGGDMALSQSTSLAAMYTYFESNAQSRLDRPVLPGDVGTVRSTVLPDSIGALGSPGPVDARSVLDFQLADVEYRARLQQGPRHWINGGVGARYAHLEQAFGQVGDFPGPLAGTLVTRSDVDFDGGGLRLALDGGRTLGSRGFSVYGRTSFSPVAGQFRADYSVFNDTTDQQLVRVEAKDDRIVPILDYEFGVAWSGPRRRWRLSAGYTAAYWFNAVTSADFIQGGGGETIMFDGLVTRIEHLW